MGYINAYDDSWLACDTTSNVGHCTWFTNGTHICSVIPLDDGHDSSPHHCMCDFSWKDPEVPEQQVVYIEPGGDSLSTM